MNTPDSSITRHRLDRTVRALCLLIEDRMGAQSTRGWTEYSLRKELVGCILGSQVRHETAVVYTNSLEEAGLLDDAWWSLSLGDSFGSIVFDVLSGQRQVVPRRARYRFPRARAAQLAEARAALARVPLIARVANDDAPRRLRQKLVGEIAGLGPKQASMFLRNIGRSYDLAILDIHVLRFMHVVGLLPMATPRVSTMAAYERAEQVVIDYADSLGYPVGYLDWAIWATMKAARELSL